MSASASLRAQPGRVESISIGESIGATWVPSLSVAYETEVSVREALSGSSYAAMGKMRPDGAQASGEKGGRAIVDAALNSSVSMSIRGRSRTEAAMYFTVVRAAVGGYMSRQIGVARPSGARFARSLGLSGHLAS
jgi:hypothetical protein